MPFGVKNAPGTFQREMRRVLNEKLNKGVFVFIDDIIIYSRTEDEQLELIDWVLSRLEAEGYYANPGKCEFMRSQVSFLGHMVSRDGLSMQQHKVAGSTQLAGAAVSEGRARVPWTGWLLSSLCTRLRCDSSAAD